MTTGQLERWAVAEPIMAAKLNQPVDALLRQRGAGLPAEVMPTPRSAGDAAPAAASRPERFKLEVSATDLVIVNDDFVYATRLATYDPELGRDHEDNEASIDIKIAKPYEIQKTPWHTPPGSAPDDVLRFHIELLDRLVIYRYETGRPDKRIAMAAQVRDPDGTVLKPAVDEPQIVWPEYPGQHAEQPDSYIWAVRVGDGPGGTGIEGVTWQDLNVGNREFIAVPLGLLV